MMGKGDIGVGNNDNNNNNKVHKIKFTDHAA